MTSPPLPQWSVPPPGAPGAPPTDEQLAAWLLELPADELALWVGIVRNGADQAARCWQENHAGNLGHLERALLELAHARGQVEAYRAAGVLLPDAPAPGVPLHRPGCTGLAGSCGCSSAEHDDDPEAHSAHDCAICLRAARAAGQLHVRVVATSTGRVVQAELSRGGTVWFGCPTCSQGSRETVGMVCQTCGTDYGAEPAGLAPDQRADLDRTWPGPGLYREDQADGRRQ